jgi:hypothetical protein
VAYMDQTKKASLAPGIKAVLKKYKMKGTISVDNHSTLCCNISEGPLDIIGNCYEVSRTRPGSRFENNPKPSHLQVNPYWISENYTGRVCEFVLALKAAMDIGNHDRSDIQTDYFDVGWYIDINVGKWNKPYRLTK